MPEAIPVTSPELPIVATVVVALLQVPPGVVSIRIAVPPAQIVVGPDTGDTAGSTVTDLVTTEVPDVYVIVTTPVETPVTVPIPGIPVAVATAGLLLLQVPKVVMPPAAVSVIELPTQTTESPVIVMANEGMVKNKAKRVSLISFIKDHF